MKIENAQAIGISQLKRFAITWQTRPCFIYALSRWEMDITFVPSESILQFKADILARSRKSPVSATVLVAPDDAMLAPLLDLYMKHGGDLVAIFGELGDNPGKALKYPPADAQEFAVKVIGTAALTKERCLFLEKVNRGI
jgi:hypothetical protein